MPDLSRCKYVDGKLYCWDKARQIIMELNTVSLDFTQCPENVLAAFIGDGDTETAEKDKGACNA